MNELDKKIRNAIKLLQVFAKDKVVEVSYSGGKDSDVILELAKMAGINYRAIYKNTTIDPPHTIAHCKSKGVEIMHPKENSYGDYIKAKQTDLFGRKLDCKKYLEQYFGIEL